MEEFLKCIFSFVWWFICMSLRKDGQWVEGESCDYFGRGLGAEYFTAPGGLKHSCTYSITLSRRTSLCQP